MEDHNLQNNSQEKTVYSDQEIKNWRRKKLGII